MQHINGNSCQRAILLILLFWHLWAVSGGLALSPEPLHRVLWDEPAKQLETMGKISDTEGSLERTFLSPAHRKAAIQLQSFMDSAGLETRIDTVANVRGKIESSNPRAPILIFGSHYDTVKDAGKYDGMLGIIVPIAAIKALILERAIEKGLIRESDLSGPKIFIPSLLSRLEISSLFSSPIEVIGFSDEEGIRFQTTFLGSRAISGSLISSGALEARDSDGISLREALIIENQQNSDEDIKKLQYSPKNVKGYVEIHMEQGPILESRNLPLGLVKGIAGQARYYVSISGTQGHAGTVPMIMRRDPMPAIAEVIAWMEKRCGGGLYSEPQNPPISPISPEDNLMCTTGRVEVWPNAFNVIPGSVNFTVDVRSRNDETWKQVIEDMKEEIREVCLRRNLQCEIVQKNTVNAVHCDSDLLEKLEIASIKSLQVVKRAGSHGYREKSNMKDTETNENSIDENLPQLVSGAGHDALAMSKIAKMAMLFVGCRGGFSHSPLEYVSPSDIFSASAAIFQFLNDEIPVPHASHMEL